MGCILVMNARAGKLHRTPSLAEMQATIADLDLDGEIDVIGSESPAHLEAILRDAVDRGAERVAVAGGDGTVRVAANILAGTEVALGIVPQGTMNNFATALGLPLALPEALRILCQGTTQRVDLGRAHGRFFTESAGVGMFASVLAMYGPHNKNPWHATRAIFRLLMNLRAHRLRLTIDGRGHEEPTVFCLAANTYRMALAMPVAPEATVTDGELDVVVFGDLRRGEVLSYYLAIRRQTHLSLPKVSSCKARHVRMEARRPLLVHLDDSVVGHTPVEIECVPQTLRVVTRSL